MSFWFNDVNIEGTISLTSNLLNHTLNLTRALSNEEINNFKNKLKIENYNLDENQLGYYLAGLIEGDGNINIPAKGKTILKRILNPRITITGHINNIEIFIFLLNYIKI